MIVRTQAGAKQRESKGKRRTRNHDLALEVGSIALLLGLVQKDVDVARHLSRLDFLLNLGIRQSLRCDGRRSCSSEDDEGEFCRASRSV